MPTDKDKICIISPNPETRRMFELAFELKGIGVCTEIDSSKFKPARCTCNAILIDVVEDRPAEWKAIASVIKMAGPKTHTAVILPHGCVRPKLSKEAAGAMVIKRPFEVFDVLRRVVEDSGCISSNY